MSLIVLGCSKNDDDGQSKGISERPQIPESVTYDLNNDSVDDFKIGYSEGAWEGAGASGGFFLAYFEPLSENKILQEYEENVSTTFLFAQMGDTIQRQATNPQSWTYRGRFTILYQGGDGVWSKEWQIVSKRKSNPYYVGVQIDKDDESLLGWLKLEIDKKTGKIDIVGHKLASTEFIVIDE